MAGKKKIDTYDLIDRIRKHLDEAWASASDLDDYRLEYLSVEVVCAPGEPERYRETICTVPELIHLLDLLSADRLVLKPPAAPAAPDLCTTCARRDHDCPLDGTGPTRECGAHIPKRSTT